VKNVGKNTTKALLHKQTPNLNACVEYFPPPKKGEKGAILGLDTPHPKVLQ
jgi:hypothetical protein